MANSRKTETLAWTLFAVSLFATTVFAGLYYSNPKSVISKEILTVTNTLNNTVTNYVTNEVIKEVEKTVKVPAAIPDDYINAKVFYDKMANAKSIGKDKVLFGMKDVATRYSIPDSIKQIVSEDEIKARYELTLRKNNVTVNSDSTNVVLVAIDASLDSPSQLLLYDLQVSVIEQQWVVRNLEARYALQTVWSTARFGYVHKNIANEELLKTTEKEAEIFANDFLTANPK